MKMGTITAVLTERGIGSIQEAIGGSARNEMLFHRSGLNGLEFGDSLIGRFVSYDHATFGGKVRAVNVRLAAPGN